MRLIPAPIFLCLCVLAFPAQAQEPEWMERVRAAQVGQGVVPGHRVDPTRTAQIIPHPQGCPARLFCGCGAAVRVFGKSVRELWLASNWFKFPRSSPGSGMVAVSRRHVFVLERHVGGNDWLVSDYNSGRNLSRLHVRSIAGYVIVNPHAMNVARAS